MKDTPATHYYKIPYKRKRLLWYQNAAIVKDGIRDQAVFLDADSQFCAYYDDDPYLYERKT